MQFGSLTFTRSLNGAAQHATVDKGVLTLRAKAKSDNFNDPDGKLSNHSAPVLLTQVDNTKPITLITQVAPQFLETYDAACSEPSQALGSSSAGFMSPKVSGMAKRLLPFWGSPMQVVHIRRISENPV